jgi:hypothetical protein
MGFLDTSADVCDGNNCYVDFGRGVYSYRRGSDLCQVLI